MQTSEPSAYLPALSARFGALVWACLDQDLPRSAVFYAERYFALDQDNHDSRHLYATALLRSGQTHSALCAVNPPKDKRCPGCDEVRAKCLSALGRHREAREALQECLASGPYLPSRTRWATSSSWIAQTNFASHT
jgi:anaphase-promoting complex subunit 3